MEVSVTNQAYIFLCSIIGGLVIGFVFDFFRICRKIIKTTNIITYIEDLLFWIIVAIIIFFLVFMTNDGELRWYAFLGVLLGVIFYNLIFSAYVIGISVTVINFIKKIILFILKIILFPIALIHRFLKRPITMIVKFIRKCLKNLLKILKSLFERTILPVQHIRKILKKV